MSAAEALGDAVGEADEADEADETDVAAGSSNRRVHVYAVRAAWKALFFSTSVHVPDSAGKAPRVALWLNVLAIHASASTVSAEASTTRPPVRSASAPPKLWMTLQHHVSTSGVSAAPIPQAPPAPPVEPPFCGWGVPSACPSCA